MLPYAALTDVGLDALSAAFLQNHIQLSFGVRIEQSALLQKRLSILQLAHGIASTTELHHSTAVKEQKRPVMDPQEIEAKLLTIIEGDIVSHQLHTLVMEWSPFQKLRVYLHALQRSLTSSRARTLRAVGNFIIRRPLWPTPSRQDEAFAASVLLPLSSSSHTITTEYCESLLTNHCRFQSFVLQVLLAK